MTPDKSIPKSNPYDVLLPLMAQFGATCSPEEFYWAVNEAYHAAESKRYDEIHRDMYEEEAMVWQRLLGMLPADPEKLTFLDIGCGTGLVGHFIATYCPERVKEMHLLDPSQDMIEVIAEKSKEWPFECVLHHGDVLSLSPDRRFDVTTINSVLHHVVDLSPFLERVELLTEPSGLLLTAHDPRHGTDDDQICKEREASTQSWRDRQPSMLQRLRRLVAPPLKRLLNIQRYDALTRETNSALRAARIITREMDNKSIWAVTDFHVPNQPGNLGKGLNIEEMDAMMPSMKMLASLTYQYHGTSWSLLTDAEKELERTWWESGDAHGAEMALAWRKTL